MSLYIDLRLRAADEGVLAAALAPLPLAGHGIALDLIGTLYAETGQTETDPDGGVLAVIAALPGWHVNLRLRANHLDLPAIESALADFVVAPDPPLRVFAD